MANKKISAFTELTEAPATGDVLPIVDVSDTTGAPTGTTKKVSLTNLSAGIVDISTSQLDAASLVTESEGISSNDNDTTLPTSAAVKDYVDAQILTKDNLDEIAEGTTNKHFTATDETKLDGIEAGADVTDTANVTAAGALMDSELTDLAGVKGVTISTLQEKPSEGAFVDGDKTKLDGIESNATADQTDAEIRTAVGNATDSNVFTDADHSKLDGIESGATADQTGAEIKTAYEAESDTNAFTDADHSKLDGIEANATADQTGAEIKAAYEAESDTNAFTDADHTKLDGLEQSDWNSSSGGSQILNKPTIPSALNDLSNVNASPSDGQVLKWDGDSSEWQAGDDAGGGGSGGISNVSEDTTPQLGGDLDVNGNSIVSTSGSNGDIVLSPDGTGRIGLGTGSPDTLVEAVGSDPVITIRDTETSHASASSTLRLAESGAAGALGRYFDVTKSGESFQIIDDNGGSPATRLTIDSSGNLGLGGTPSGLLHLTASTDPVAILTSSTHGQNFHVGVDTSEGAGSPSLVIGTGTSVGSGTKLTLTPDGTLDLKSEKLKLNGSGGSDGQVLTTDGSGGVSWEDGSGNTTSSGLYEHAHTISADYTIATGNNAFSAGPVTVDDGYSVTVPSGSTWVIA